MSLPRFGTGKTGSGAGKHVSDYMLNRLKEWGVERIFGYPGDGINGFLGAFHRAKGKPEFIQARHEEMAAFMATAHAKFTGDFGVCIATSGPGAIHLLNGLYDAKLDHQPVVAIVGQQKQLSVGADYQQEVDLNTLFKDVSAYVTPVMHPASARHVIDRAVRIAMASRSVSTIIIPEDIQEANAMEAPPRAHGSVFSSIGYIEPEITPPQNNWSAPPNCSTARRKSPCWWARARPRPRIRFSKWPKCWAAELPRRLLGRAHPPDDLPFVTGPIGLLGTKPSNDMVMGCDLLFMIGTSFPYAEWLPKEGSCKCVEIDIDARYIAHRFPVDVPLVGDAKCTLRALMPLAEIQEGPILAGKDREERAPMVGSILDDRAMQKGDPMNPQRVIHELSPRLPDRCILVADSGSSTNWWARHLKMRKGMDASLSGTLATMGAGTPYAIGARFAFPDRPVIAVVGDGAFQMNGMNEMITIKRYHAAADGERRAVHLLRFQQSGSEPGDVGAARPAAATPNSGSQYIPDFPYAEICRVARLQRNLLRRRG